MRDNTEKKPAVLFALGHDANMDLIKEAIGVPVKRLIGCDNGVEEVIFLAEVENQETFDLIYEMAQAFDQEYIFLIRPSRECAIAYLDSRGVVPVGHLKAVPESTAKRGGTYTTDGTTYWVAS